MKKGCLIFCIISILLFGLSGCGNVDTGKSNGSAKVVLIGKQIWMTKNLNTDRFQNGDPIPEAKTEAEWRSYSEFRKPAWCYYNNDSLNGEEYGKLYNWHAVNDPRGLGPKGWHVPTDEDWAILTNYLGRDPSDKMKSNNGWSDDGNGTNTSGFYGLPGGYRNLGVFDNFIDIGSSGYWWSSTAFYGIGAWGIGLHDYSGADVHRFHDNGSQGYSVRCVRD